MARTNGVSALLAALPEECAMRRRKFPTRRANGAALNVRMFRSPPVSAGLNTWNATCDGKKYLCTAMYAGRDAADQVHCATAVE